MTRSYREKPSDIPVQLDYTSGMRLMTDPEGTWFFLLLALCIMLLPLASPAETLTVRVPRPESHNDFRHPYFLELLELALERTQGDFGDYSIVPAELRMAVQERGIRYLQAGKIIDVIWTMTSNERERVMRPIRIPLLKGLLGYRVLLIQKDSQERFDTVHSLADLQAMTAGQGAGWPDVKILQANGIQVTTSPDYERLFTMLQRGRFDFLPRGVTEAWQEIVNRPGSGLVIENHLLLVYEAPIYYFVHHDNEALATRLQHGLTLTMKDGSFDALFKKHYFTRLRHMMLPDRRRIQLSNPHLSADTPQDSERWHHPPSLGQTP